MCQEDGRTREIIGILENLAENSRTIIFASKKQDVINLHNVCTIFILFSSLAPIKAHLGLRSVAKYLCISTYRDFGVLHQGRRLFMFSSPEPKAQR